MEIYQNKLFRINGLTTDQRTENPRVGSSILSRPTFLTRLKLGTYMVFVSIFFYFSSSEFLCNESKRLAVSSWFTVTLITCIVHMLYTHFFWF